MKSRKVVIKSIHRLINETSDYKEYAYAPIREGVQLIQMACMAKSGIKFNIKKITPRKAVLTFISDKDVIQDLFTTLALTDFIDKYSWRFII